LLAVEGRAHGENRLTVLDRDDSPRREASAIAVAMHLVNYRDPRIAGAHEITVERMCRAARVQRANRRNKSLNNDLATENALPSDLGAGTAKQILLQCLKI